MENVRVALIRTPPAVNDAMSFKANNSRLAENIVDNIVVDLHRWIQSDVALSPKFKLRTKRTRHCIGKIASNLEHAKLLKIDHDNIFKTAPSDYNCGQLACKVIGNPVRLCYEFEKRKLDLI